MVTQRTKLCKETPAPRKRRKRRGVPRQSREMERSAAPAEPNRNQGGTAPSECLHWRGWRSDSGEWQGKGAGWKEFELRNVLHQTSMELNWDWLRWLLTHFMTATGDVSIFYSDKDTCFAWPEQAGNSSKAADNATVCLSSDEEVQKSQEKAKRLGQLQHLLACGGS